MRLYHHPQSTNARRAVMTAVQLGTPVELVMVDFAKGEHRQPQFLKLNPNHKVPVLDDDGFVLWESQAIMQYLCDLTPGQRLYPGAIRARADVNRWLFWSAQHFGPAVAILNWEHWVKGRLGLGGADPDEVKRGEALVREFAAILDTHLAGREWICAGGLSLADLSLGACLTYTERSHLPLGGFGHLGRWLAQVQTLEAWKTTEPA